MKCHRAALYVIALAAAPAGYSLADEADCKPMFEAMTHLFNTPSHQYLKQTNTLTGDKTVSSEIINTGKALYIMVDGKWHNSDITSAQLQEQEESSRKKAKLTTCKLVHEESLDGVPVRLFTAHTETEYGASDQQMWIAKKDGLPVRETIEMTMGEHAGTSHAEIRVTYSGITAPVVPPSAPSAAASP
jgi:hypothetical protein